MVRIIGIDPGLRRCGWGVIESEGNRLSYVAWAFLGLVPTVPGLEDRTLCVPFALVIVTAVRELRERPAASAVGTARDWDSSALARP